MIIMSMELHYVSELRPPTGLFFNPHVTYEYGEPWQNIDRGKSLVHQPELSVKPASRDI
jgi:hypothetical protein